MIERRSTSRSAQTRYTLISTETTRQPLGDERLRYLGVEAKRVRKVAKTYQNSMTELYKNDAMACTLVKRCNASVRARFFSAKSVPKDSASLEVLSLYWKFHSFRAPSSLYEATGGDERRVSDFGSRSGGNVRCWNRERKDHNRRSSVKCLAGREAWEGGKKTLTNVQICEMGELVLPRLQQVSQILLTTAVVVDRVGAWRS